MQTQLAFKHEQRRLVGYLTKALEPVSFREVVATKLTLQEFKPLKNDAIGFCKYPKLLPAPALTALAGRAAVVPPTLVDEAAEVVVVVMQAPGSPGMVVKPVAMPGIGPVDAAAADVEVVGVDVEAQVVVVAELEARLSDKEGRTAPHDLAVPASTEPGHEAAAATEPSGAVEARVDGLEVHALLLDTGADESLVAQGVVDAIKARGTPVFLADIPPRTLSPIGGKDFVVHQAVTFREVGLATSAGPLMLRNLACLVEDGNTSLDFMLGRPIMTVLGYSSDELLVRARGTKSEWELGDKGQVGDDAETKALQRMCRMQTRTRDIALDRMALEGLVDNTAPTDQDWGGSDTVHGGTDPPETIFKTKNLTPAYWQLPLSSSGAQVLAFQTRDGSVHDMLDSKLAAARAKGLSAKGVKRLREILLRRQDSFRLEFGSDPPVKVAPLQVRVKVNAQPTKAQPRRYSSNDKAFLDRHTAKLQEFGLVSLNHRSRWASAPRIVRKKEQGSDPTADPRMTIDTRGVNERTEAMPWPMPVLEVVLSALEGAQVFFALDWFRGYWQLPLHEDSQELFTFITHRGMYTPTRVPMGATDAVAYCQGVVEEIFGDLLGNGILVWLDDILGYAESEEELLQLLDQVLARCEAYGLKLHAKKCDFFEIEVKWCGKMVSAAGVRHYPDRVQGLVEMQPSQTAGDLQQFLCAVNWMRQSIPEYNRLTAGLHAVLEEAMKAAGSRKKVKLAKFPLDKIGWGDPQLADLAAVKAVLLEMVPLAHPSPTAEVCLYTDASQDSWGAVATQLEPGEVQLPLEQQHHRPLAFLSGRFVGASSRWPTIEKEAYARNLVYIFAPYGSDTAMARCQADKLRRWALSLLSFTYVIEHVPGETNVWGDLLSRWGATKMPTAAPTGARMSRLAAVGRVSPLEAVDFVWPNEDEIRAAQLARRAKDSMEPSQPPLRCYGYVWLLMLGLPAIAKALEDLFSWRSLRMDVAVFVG
ncbi:Hypothetical protein PHPALM_37794 [Phytophthora palmivora]|uniref:Reverse transcriptase domain-containing protein n=1 Tax=Phytophthora palmivora TaxID=4796 RepID=A0A2P4WWJ1_9STRA|nr:Hypothetical protein PHPALM_37794 [Phytophthora palmivora]